MLSLTKCVVAGAVAAFFTTAHAQHGAASAACKEDVQKLCPDVQPGEGRVLQCLKTHQKDVSPKCANYMKQVKAEIKKVSDACEPDIEKFCWETPMGKGGIAKCLHQHSADLSPDCKTAVSKAKGK
jgi:hypothetical protein